LVLCRVRLCRHVGIKAEPILQGVDRLLHALEIVRVDLEAPALGSRSKIAWKISWNHARPSSQKNVLAT
jgi:hypothetical protein